MKTWKVERLNQEQIKIQYMVTSTNPFRFHLTLTVKWLHHRFGEIFVIISSDFTRETSEISVKMTASSIRRNFRPFSPVFWHQIDRSHQNNCCNIFLWFIFALIFVVVYKLHLSVLSFDRKKNSRKFIKNAKKLLLLNKAIFVAGNSCLKISQIIFLVCRIASYKNTISIDREACHVSRQLKKVSSF